MVVGVLLSAVLGGWGVYWCGLDVVRLLCDVGWGAAVLLGVKVGVLCTAGASG